MSEQLEAARAVLEQERQLRLQVAGGELAAFIKQWEVRHRVRLRVGVESVEVAAGVYGQRAFFHVVAE